MPDTLTAFGISQDPATGVLRIYPAPLIEQDDLRMFVCNSSGFSENITLTLCK